MTYTNLLFDFDGTLTPSLDLWLEAWSYALATYELELTEEIIIRRCFNRYYSEVAADFALGEGAELSRRVQNGLERAYRGARLYPGVAEMLTALVRAGSRLGLVTSSFRPQIMAALDRLGLTDLFAVVITGNDITYHKPHPQPVQLALAALDGDPAETLFVGDNWVDVKAGQAVGTSTALFLPAAHARFYDFEVLRASQPDLIFADYSELAAHLALLTPLA